MKICRFIQNRLLLGKEGALFSLFQKIIRRHIKKCTDCNAFARIYSRISEKASPGLTLQPSEKLREKCLQWGQKKQDILSVIYRKKTHSFVYAMGAVLMLLVITFPYLRFQFHDRDIFIPEYYLQDILFREYEEEFTSEMGYVFQVISFLDQDDNGFM